MASPHPVSILIVSISVSVIQCLDVTNSTTMTATEVTSQSLLLTSMEITEPTPSVDKCPEQCVCNRGRYTVSCYNQGLTNIPTGIPDYVWYLSLNGNNFQNISFPAFSSLPNLVSLQLVQSRIKDIQPNSFNGLSQLRKLDLRSNVLQIIENGTFSGLVSLTELNLQGNDIQTIDSLAFKELRLLNNLNMDGNLITDLPNNLFSENTQLEKLSLRFCQIADVQTVQFANLTNLKELDLSGNAITKVTSNSFDKLPSLNILHLTNMFPGLEDIEENALQGLTELRTLDISDNSLSTISTSHVDMLMSLELLILKNNPWSCNCQMGDLLEWLRQGDIDYFDTMWRCFTPKALQGLIVFTVSPMDKFTCVPYIFTAPQNTSVDFQNPAVFSVSVGGDPSLSIEWYLPDGKLIGSRVDSPNEYVAASGNVMIIQQAMGYHTGEYRVAVENYLGATYAYFEVFVMGVPTTAQPSTTLETPATSDLPPPCIYAPIQIRVTDITDTSATLQWTPYNSPDLLAYIVHQNEFGKQDSYHSTLTNSSQTSKILHSLTPNSNFILCVTVYLRECPSFTSLDQCVQINTKGGTDTDALESLNVKHRNELIVLSVTCIAITLLLVATIFMIFWKFKQPKSLRKYEFQATDDTIRFADLEPMNVTAMRLDKRSSAMALPLEQNGSPFTYDNKGMNDEDVHEYETPNEYPMKTFLADIHKDPLPPDLPEDDNHSIEMYPPPPDLLDDDLDRTYQPGMATLLSELRFHQEASDTDSDDDHLP